MKTVSASEKLSASILVLAKQQEVEQDALKTQFYLIYESLRPINLIRSTIDEAVQSAEFKHSLVNNLMSVLVGFITKKAVVGNTNNPLKALFGTVIQFAVSGLVSSNVEHIKSFFSSLFSSESNEKEE